jgi:hypothetical protein
MSIAELIMQGTNRASESTSWVGDSLAKLGQNVGAALAQKEQQKQAQAMLPFLQQSMQESMKLAGEGKTGEAYSMLMPFLADPSVINNPNLRQVIPAFESGIKIAGDEFYKKEQLRVREDMYNTRYGGGETEVIYDTPTAEQMADPNYRPFARVVPKTTPTRSGGGGAGMGGGSAREGAIAIDQSTPLPGMEAGFTDTIPEMDTSGEQRGFGWSYQEGYRPTADRRKSFEKEYNDFLNAPVEEQEKIKEQVQVTQEDVPEGKQVIPFRMALNPNIVGIVGPESSVEVEKIVQVFKDGSQEDRRELIKKNPLAATINDLEKADNTISSNNTLLNIHKQVDGNYSRVTTERVFQTDDPKTDTFKIFIDGNEAPNVQTDANGAEAIGIMKAKEVAALTGKYDFVRGKPTAEAPSPTQGGLPAVQPPPAAEIPEIPEEAMALQKIVEQGQVAKAGETAKNVEKRIKDIDTQIKQLSSATIAGSEGTISPGRVSLGRVTRAKTPEQAQTDIQKIVQLKTERQLLFAKTEKAYNTAKSEGRVFQNADEVKSSKKKFPAGTIIYIGREPAKVK